MINTDLEQKAKQSLKYFINETLSLIKNLVYDGIDVDKRPFFIKDLSDQIRPAWKEFEEDFKIDHALDQIQKTKAESLQVSGLYGKQLNLKLSVFENWKKRFSEKPIKKILLRLLDAIDSILDSVIAATGMDQALKEIKDILRNSIDED
jgi:hypothetical protein